MTIDTLERKLKPLQAPVENDFLRWLYLHLPPQPMKNKKMHQAYLKAIQILVRESGELNAADSAAVEQYLRSVMPLVAEYEKKEFPLASASPEEIFGFLMRENDLTQYDLAKELGGQPVVSEVLRGKRKLTRDHIERLSKRFSVTPAPFYPAGAWEKGAAPSMVFDKTDKRRRRKS